MATKVIWSLGAIIDRKEIIEYWNDRNKSDVFGRKLNLLFKEAIKTAQQFPHSGKPTNRPDTKLKIVRHYVIPK